MQAKPQAASEQAKRQRNAAPSRPSGQLILKSDAPLRARSRSRPALSLGRVFDGAVYYTPLLHTATHRFYTPLFRPPAWRLTAAPCAGLPAPGALTERPCHSIRAIPINEFKTVTR